MTTKSTRLKMLLADGADGNKEKMSAWRPADSTRRRISWPGRIMRVLCFVLRLWSTWGSSCQIDVVGGGVFREGKTRRCVVATAAVGERL